MTRLNSTSIAVAIAATAGLMAASAQAQTVSIGTLPQGSLSYSIGAAVAKVISDKTDLNTRAIGIGGDNIYLPQVNQGRLEMSTAAGPSAIFASKGTGPYAGHKNPNLRVVARLLEFQTGYMVKNSSKITSLADLKGLKVPSGYTSQKLVGTLVRATMAAEGLSYDNVKGVPVPNFVRGTDELVAGRVAVSYLAPGSGITRKAHASIGIRFISLKETPGSLKIIQNIAPGVFYTMVNPSKRMPYITKPVKMLGFDYLILAGSMLKNEIVYKSAKALHLNKKALIAGHGVFRGFSPKLIAKKGLGVPFHPGAVKYFKEAGLM